MTSNRKGLDDLELHAPIQRAPERRLVVVPGQRGAHGAGVQARRGDAAGDEEHHHGVGALLRQRRVAPGCAERVGVADDVQLLDLGVCRQVFGQRAQDAVALRLNDGLVVFKEDAPL